ncbi:MAG: radical SAM protein [Rhodospirillaceae bacterium]|nr:radical SAM protein [Rhodospirillaceae bacterium]
MATCRDEAWGQLVYQPDLDEFEAQTPTDVQGIHIDRPISAGCLVTGKCNLKCQYCYGNDESLPAEEMTTSEWAKAFLRLRNWGVMRVDLSGGEPTVRADLAEIADAALGADLSVVLSTNGLLLAKRTLGLLPKSVRLHISIDSGFAQIHEASRVRRNLLPSTGSLQQVTSVTAEAVHAGYRVRALTCIGRHNFQQLAELGERLAISGVNEWNISRVLAAGRAGFNDSSRWAVDDNVVLEEVDAIRNCYPWMRVRYSNRTTQMDTSCWCFQMVL